MKLARATKEDMKMAERLLWILNDIFEDGNMPRDIYGNWDETEKDCFKEKEYDDLTLLYNRIKQCYKMAPGGLTRVILGFITIYENGFIDENNECLAINLEKIKERIFYQLP